MVITHLQQSVWRLYVYNYVMLGLKSSHGRPWDNMKILAAITLQVCNFDLQVCNFDQAIPTKAYWRARLLDATVIR
ncbi:hypothetical protein KC19_VG111100 [Ceratodon purpureus]|uniref:Uncharacterized protein n=1 Tax=Ceratodon purpureus TaxID=3225 RepID=A0A8T0HPA0_CERPU|nr:hypothetical protein KC19_VG111100 [Ceratodon purpureus]